MKRGDSQCIRAHCSRPAACWPYSRPRQPFAQPAETQAANPPTDQPAADETGNENETIVVTAQLREQRPVEVPLALTTYSSRFLEDLNIQDFEDLARFMPGFASRTSRPTIRLSAFAASPSISGFSFFEPRVSIFQDGVSIAKPRGAYVELFDLERVEISKGPQSTLYGRGALIGAVNIVQAKPRMDDTFGMVRGEFGNLDYWLGEAMLNAPSRPMSACASRAATRPATALSTACFPASTTSTPSRPARRAPSCASSRRTK